MIFFGDWEGMIYAYNLNNGNKIWEYDNKKDGTYPWKNAISTSPVIYNNSVIFGGRSNRLYSFDTETGNVNWIHNSPTDQWLVGGPTISDGVIYLGSSDQHIFHAIDAVNGKIIWQCDLDCRIWGTALVQNENVYIGSNSFYCIDKQTGKIQSQIKFDKVHEDVNYGKYINKTANIHSSPKLTENCNNQNLLEFHLHHRHLFASSFCQY